MTPLEEVSNNLRDAEKFTDALRAQRDDLIRKEAAKGTPKVHIARSAGISRNMVLRIIANAKKTPSRPKPEGVRVAEATRKLGLRGALDGTHDSGEDIHESGGNGGDDLLNGLDHDDLPSG